MTFPAFILGATLATLFAAAMHLWRGGGLGRLLLYQGLAWGGFWGGHLLAQQLGWTLLRLGPLYLGVALLASLLSLAAGHWIFVVQPGE
ncbi:MAG: hypothetical protein KF821_01195 [Anaerolineales bacterium]|jgi:hypothetical protein|nr:hypothetical protein [Anaerolineales bacterium]MBX3004425.1 hypothetical protein [Anaerolineales bacterium]MCW5838359.1 hypothetical protein [Anaerolineales bacterium]MCW5888128.1 hypothetical protein [Anaerolineales bacterium]